MSGLPKPFYEDGSVTIYHGDCRELLPEIEADVLVTDPPYGMAYDSGWSKHRAIEGDGDLGARDWVLDHWGNRPALVFGTWRLPRPEARTMLIWDKGDSPGMGDLSLPWGPSYEEIYVRGDGWSGPRKAGVLRHIGRTGADAKQIGHPTPKPLSLMVDLIGYCPAGVILDPFMGSGTTLRAAKDLGRKAIGIELEERYCQIAAERCSQEVLDLGAAV